MNIIQIDGEQLLARDELHAILQEKLELGEHYGRNLDALWDCLTGEVSMPITIQWVHFEKSKQVLGGYADQVIDLMREVEEEIEGFTLELK
ncbi:barstar family protein [Paenibacillus sp. ACRSA]|uniref:barstar family protein n=1 Tax=Paenibacillus sp. ACRSA TaxID=2918211 RepID=UPI001EF500FE|nr:barstar family protein [Paenibacillus sp. ACRSA]MCG7378591.1 barstar family protein [Paenibacillus sp. ACRSA]